MKNIKSKNPCAASICEGSTLNSFKKAFTLSETLIVLVVLGVIAAITVPGLVTRQIERSNMTKLKKSMAVYDKAIQSLVIHNDIKNMESLKSMNTAGCTNTTDIFKKSQTIDGCRFKTSDGMWWDITDITKPIVAFKRDDLTSANAQDLVNYKAFYFVTSFNSKTGAFTTNNRLVEVGANKNQLYKLYGYLGYIKKCEDAAQCYLSGDLDYTQECTEETGHCSCREIDGEYVRTYNDKCDLISEFYCYNGVGDNMNNCYGSMYGMGYDGIYLNSCDTWDNQTYCYGNAYKGNNNYYCSGSSPEDMAQNCWFEGAYVYKCLPDTDTCLDFNCWTEDPSGYNNDTCHGSNSQCSGDYWGGYHCVYYDCTYDMTDCYITYADDGATYTDPNGKSVPLNCSEDENYNYRCRYIYVDGDGGKYSCIASGISSSMDKCTKTGQLNETKDCWDSSCTIYGTTDDDPPISYNCSVYDGRVEGCYGEYPNPQTYDIPGGKLSEGGYCDLNANREVQWCGVMGYGGSQSGNNGGDYSVNCGWINDETGNYENCYVNPKDDYDLSFSNCDVNTKTCEYCSDYSGSDRCSSYGSEGSYSY